MLKKKKKHFVSHYMDSPLSADVPEARGPGQELLPLGVPPYHHPTVLLAKQTLQLRVDPILTGSRTKSVTGGQKEQHATEQRGPPYIDGIRTAIYQCGPVSSKEQP